MLVGPESLHFDSVSGVAWRVPEHNHEQKHVVFIVMPDIVEFLPPFFSFKDKLRDAYN